MRTWLTRALPAAALIVAAGLAGFFAHGWLAERPAPLAVTSASPSVQAHRASDGGEPDGGAPHPRVIPDTLPDIAFADRDGLPRRFSDWKGRPLLVNFWATWCEPCLEEIPLLERLSGERTADGLQVLGVALDSRAAVLDYARRAAIHYPLLIGEQPGLEVIRALGMQAVFPFSVFTDARGRIVTVKIGRLRADQARLILGRIDDLDRGRIDLATARSEIAQGIAKLAIAHAQATAGPGL